MKAGFVIGSCILALFWLGCTSTSQVSSDSRTTYYTYQTFNEAMKGENLDVVLSDGSRMQVMNLVVRTDSVQWIRIDDGKSQSLATRDITRVEIASHTTGAIEGMVIVGGCGAALLTIPGLLSGQDSDRFRLGIAFGLFVGGVGGGLVGLGLGAAIGHTFEYQFVPDSTQASRE